MSEHYHRYSPISDSPDAIVEVCTECKHRLVTKKSKDGRIDNKKWLKDHIADTAQPTGATAKVFEQLYGEPKV